MPETVWIRIAREIEYIRVNIVDAVVVGGYDRNRIEELFRFGNRFDAWK